jgi:hypothetical protein
MPWKAGHLIGIYFFTDSARRDSVLCDQHYCIDRFYASQISALCVRQQKPYPPLHQGKVCCAGRNIRMVRRNGQSMRRLVIRKVFALFSAIYSYDLNHCFTLILSRHMKIWNAHQWLSSPQSDNTGSIAPLYRDYI